MNESFTLILALVLGVMLGTFFFGGLWLTVKKGLSSKRAAFWFAGSLLLRTGVVISGFYWVTNGRWERLLVCMIGFFLARLIVIRLTRMTTLTTPKDKYAPDS